jgi:hypothetical protein
MAGQEIAGKSRKLQWEKRFLARVAQGQRVTWTILPVNEKQATYEVFARNGNGQLQELREHRFSSIRLAKRYCQAQEAGAR